MDTQLIDRSIDPRRESDVQSCQHKIVAPEYYAYVPLLRDAVGKQPLSVTDEATNAYENASSPTTARIAGRQLIQPASRDGTSDLQSRR
jgi:hypothetical protein